ncbi:hypothetical protein PACTADRAFT_74789 [Pachysolen tannophilus NRRL Y-2460]|uniref:glucan endo-1,3-beta-D-glucosidase n=1 Tax=Pachysolen tannophilus NRRL Y-2460 TaxID=669874 RepID=A0A1E4TZS4_PACTA|nr:hypothetical protein PACTADRAFT_74789 [Pachysolen tannophilus NRRL Y-2460]
MKYFERLSPNSKAAALDELISKYDYVKGEFNFQYRNSSQPASKIDRKAPHRSNAKSSRGRVLYNTFEGINEKYKKDKEIEALMNNSALQNVFYGIDYAPRGVIAPICGASLHEIMLDLAVLSRVTTRIRTYGMQCDQPNFVLDALLELGLNMTLSMGVWIGADENLNSAQLSVMEDVLRSYPRRLFDSVMIGNEVLFRQEKSSNDLVNYITKTKEILNRIGYTDLPVGTSEIGSKIDSMVLQSSDIIGANVHPFFGGDDVKVATKWTLDFLHNQIAAKSGNKNIFVSEVGWPSGGGKYINSVADRESLEYFINNWVCEVNKKDIEWYWFEAFDEPWKKIYDTPSTQWEAQWGIFTSDRVLKITLPDCNDYANSTAVN